MIWLCQNHKRKRLPVPTCVYYSWHLFTESVGRWSSNTPSSPPSRSPCACAKILKAIWSYVRQRHECKDERWNVAVGRATCLERLVAKGGLLRKAQNMNEETEQCPSRWELLSILFYVEQWKPGYAPDNIGGTCESVVRVGPTSLAVPRRRIHEGEVQQCGSGIGKCHTCTGAEDEKPWTVNDENEMMLILHPTVRHLGWT